MDSCAVQLNFDVVDFFMLAFIMMNKKITLYDIYIYILKVVWKM